MAKRVAKGNKGNRNAIIKSQYMTGFGDVEALYSNIGDVTNPDVCIRYIQGMAKESKIDIEAINRVYDEHRYDEEYVKRFNDEFELTGIVGEAAFLMVDTGYVNAISGQSIFTSFIRTERGYCGAKVGTLDYLIEEAKTCKVMGNKSYNERHGIKTSREVYEEDEHIASGECPNEEDEEKDSLKILAESIAQYMMVPKSWEKIDYKCIKYYIESIKTIIENNVNDWEGFCGVHYNEDKKIILVNTGLIDTMCNDIFLAAKFEDGVMSDIIADTRKIGLKEYGFSVAEVNSTNTPFRFYRNESEIEFAKSVSEIDTSDRRRLEHAVVERRERFPREFRDMSKENLARLLVSSIEHTMKLIKRNYISVKYMYDRKRQCIQFILPCYLSNDTNGKPEVAVLLRNRDGVYQITTVLSYTMAELDAKTFDREPISWTI